MGRFSRRPPGHRLPPIRYRLQQTFYDREADLASFSDAELGLVRTWTSGGLARLARPGLQAHDRDAAERAWKQLTRDRYLSPGSPKATGDGDIPEEVGATAVEDGSAVVLRGDYAIVSSLRGHPGSVIEARRSRPSGPADPTLTVYTGVGPDVMLFETPADDGRRDFRLLRADRGGTKLWFLCGITPDGLDGGPQAVPTAFAPPLRRARVECETVTELTAARPFPPHVDVERLLVGAAAPGLWLARPDDDAAPVTWASHTEVSQRISDLVYPPDDLPRWLAPPDQRR